MSGCKVKVTSVGAWHSYPCSREATRDGYCTQHHPDSVKKRHEKQTAIYKTQHANSIYGRHDKPLAKLKKIQSAVDEWDEGLGDGTVVEIQLILEGLK